MFSPDSSDITFPAGHPQLLSELSLLPSDASSSRATSSSANDRLSLSELSIRPFHERPFSLLATSTPTHGRGDVTEDEERGDSGEDRERSRQLAARLREEKLQSDIFILKKLNTAFASFHEALDDTGSANERIAGQLEQTDALLNKYINILSKSEDFSRLIFDEKWLGADDDEETLERERKRAEEKARLEAEERALAARRERERIDREEKERVEREGKERAERERKEKMAARGGVRGVRGTRASMRGARTSQSSSTSAVRASTSGVNAGRAGSGKIPAKLPKASLSPTSQSSRDARAS